MPTACTPGMNGKACETRRGFVPYQAPQQGMETQSKGRLTERYMARQEAQKEAVFFFLVDQFNYKTDINDAN